MSTDTFLNMSQHKHLAADNVDSLPVLIDGVVDSGGRGRLHSRAHDTHIIICNVL